MIDTCQWQHHPKVCPSQCSCPPPAPAPSSASLPAQELLVWPSQGAHLVWRNSAKWVIPTVARPAQPPGWGRVWHRAEANKGSRRGNFMSWHCHLKKCPGPPSPWGTFPSSPIWFRSIKPVAVNRDFFLEAHAPASLRSSWNISYKNKIHNNEKLFCLLQEQGLYRSLSQPLKLQKGHWKEYSRI